MKNRLLDLTHNLSQALDKAEVKPVASSSAPGQMLMVAHVKKEYEEKIKDLEAQLAAQGTATELRLDVLDPNPFQPRIRFYPQSLQELADSIKAVGLMQPILVRKVGERFQIVAGERRFRAHLLLGLQTIKVIITDVSDEQMAVLALVENVNREDLSDYEISKAITKSAEFFDNRVRMAEALGISRSQLYRYLAFAKLPPFVIDSLEHDPSLLGASVAYDLLKYVDSEEAGAKGIEALQQLWPQVENNTLEQTKLCAAVEGLMKQPEHKARTVTSERKPLVVGKTAVGHVSKDARFFNIRIKTSALTDAQEEKLRVALESILQEAPSAE